MIFILCGLPDGQAGFPVLLHTTRELVLTHGNPKNNIPSFAADGFQKLKPD
jgi:hypothetical protein